jgi:FAD/FMN-containing dehydrogenase
MASPTRQRSMNAQPAYPTKSPAGWPRRLRAETRGEVLFSPADCGRYATDASIYQETPVGVFVPRTRADDVQMALDICRDLGVPIVPRGGGTSQCGQTVGAGLVIDHSRHMRRVLGIDTDQQAQWKWSLASCWTT